MKLKVCILTRAMLDDNRTITFVLDKILIVKILIAECRTGEVRVTQGHGLCARFIIHTVGPVYNVKYQTAAQNTLHCCYR